MLSLGLCNVTSIIIERRNIMRTNNDRLTAELNLSTNSMPEQNKSHTTAAKAFENIPADTLSASAEFLYIALYRPSREVLLGMGYNLLVCR